MAFFCNSSYHMTNTGMCCAVQFYHLYQLAQKRWSLLLRSYGLKDQRREDLALLPVEECFEFTSATCKPPHVCLLTIINHAMIDFVSKVFRIIRVTPQSWKMLIRGHKLRYLWPLEFLSASRFLNLDLDSRMRRTIPSYKKLKGEHQ